VSRTGRRVLLVVGIPIGLFLCLFILVAAPWLLSVAYHLLLGWTTHAGTVLPQVTFNWSGVGMLALCVALAAGIGHRFCRWLWQGTGHQDPWRLRWTISGLGMVVLMFSAGMAITAVAHQTGWLLRSKEPLLSSGSNERNASTSLKTIASAQADYRGNDRDGNQINDFWRADIAGLYAAKGPDGQPLKLIELSVAAADDRPVTDLKPYAEKSPKAGYWFSALRYADEATKVDATGRFAACAYPANPTPTSFMFLITENNIVYRKPYEGAPPDLCPDDPRKDGWSPLD
jgi:hypothetical protein